MKRIALIMIVIAVVDCNVGASSEPVKESFVVKRKHQPSTSTLKEQYAETLGEIIERMPDITEKLVKEQERLTREIEKLLHIQKDAIHNLYDLLDGQKTLEKQELQKLVDSANKTLRLLDKNYSA